MRIDEAYGRSLAGLRVLVTGHSGMLGHYLIPLLREQGATEITTLSRGLTSSRNADPDAPISASDIVCDLAKEIPDLGERRFDLVFHLAGGEDDDAPFLNEHGTENLLAALAPAPPEAFVLLSSHSVYSRSAGDGITEHTPLRPSSHAGRSKARAEQIARDFAGRTGMHLAILRPAHMFGTGVHGEMARMFAKVLAGRFILIRGEEGLLSLVTAFDTARAAIGLAGRDGTWNIAWPEPFSWAQLAEAMSANAGARRRMPTLPPKWADAIRGVLGRLPAVKEMIGRDVIERRSSIRTLSTSLLAGDCPGLLTTFHDPVEVIARREPSYPYESK